MSRALLNDWRFSDEEVTLVSDNEVMI